MNPSVIVVSPASKLLGLAVDASRDARRGGLRLITAPTLIEGRVFAEVLQPTALIVDAEFAGDGQRSLLAAAAVAGAMPVVLGGQGEPSSGFVARVPADRAALGEWLRELRSVERPAPPEGDMLAMVRARYAASLGEKAASMVVSAAAVLEGGADPEGIEGARRIAHRLRGSAGSYGFPAFGEIAARIDAALLGGLVSPTAASLTRAIEILALWRQGPDPLGAPWPRLRIRGGHTLVGEISPIAHGLRIDVDVAAEGELEGESAPWIGEIIERDEEGEGGAGTSRPTLDVGVNEVRTSEGETFARASLGARLPGLLSGWLGRLGPTTT